MISESPNLSTLMQAHIRAEMASTYVCQPGRIVAYNANSQRATVELLIRDFVIDRTVPEVVYDTEPTRIADVPIMALGSPTMGWIWVPPSVGDTVLVWFADRSLAEVKGGAGDVFDPVEVADVGALHDLTDAVAMLIPNISTNGARSMGGVGANGPAIIPGTGKYVFLGSPTASSFAAKADLVDDRIDYLRQALKQIIIENGLTPAPDYPVVTALASVASSKVKLT